MFSEGGHGSSGSEAARKRIAAARWSTPIGSLARKRSAANIANTGKHRSVLPIRARAVGRSGSSRIASIRGARPASRHLSSGCTWRARRASSAGCERQDHRFTGGLRTTAGQGCRAGAGAGHGFRNPPSLAVGFRQCGRDARGATQGAATRKSRCSALVFSDPLAEEPVPALAPADQRSRSSRAIRAATSSAIARLAVRPGDSMPKSCITPAQPCSSGPSMRKSAAGSPGPLSLGRTPL